MAGIPLGKVRTRYKAWGGRYVLAQHAFVALVESGELDGDRPGALGTGDEVEGGGVELDVSAAGEGELGELLSGVGGAGGEGEEGGDEGAEESHGRRDVSSFRKRQEGS
jgi:hypothetical protein